MVGRSCKTFRCFTPDNQAHAMLSPLGCLEAGGFVGVGVGPELSARLGAAEHEAIPLSEGSSAGCCRTSLKYRCKRRVEDSITNRMSNMIARRAQEGGHAYNRVTITLRPRDHVASGL